MLPSTAYAAAGVVLAASITGGISFVNLVISKDQKTSEFRQAWIDALRNDISEMTGHIFRISTLCEYYLRTNKGKEDEAIKSLVNDVGEDIATVSMLYHRIILRLNPKDDKQLIAAVTDLHDMLSDMKINMSNQDLVDKKTEGLIKHADKLLKDEWKRVKRGEPAFYITKYLIIILSITFVVSGFIYKKTISDGIKSIISSDTAAAPK